MNKITFFHRHNNIGFSIQKVFGTLISEITKTNYIENYYMPSYRSMPWDIVINSYYTFKHRNKHGINHVTGHIHDVLLALIGCKCILTVHDLVFIENVKNPIKRLYKWIFWLYIPSLIADKIVCISAETERKILNRIKTKKTLIIHNPLDPEFEFVDKEFNEYKPVILHIGTGWNKNLERTIMALRDIPCCLRIIGKIDQKIISLLTEFNIEFSNVFNLTDKEIREEYVNCDIVNFPSVYEGFGMPIIEGQKTGRIVIASKIEPLIEVSGGAVHFVNPSNIESIRNGYLEIISNKKYREKLILSGLENVKKFSVESISFKYIQLYRSL